MAPPPDSAVENYQRQQQIAATAALMVRRLWSRLSGDFDEAWATLGPQIELVVTSAQLAAADQASLYIPAVLAEQGIEAEAEGQLVSAMLSGIASDGRDLADLLYEPIIQTRSALGSGVSYPDALDVGSNALQRMTLTQVQDAGRTAESIESVARPTVTRYVRMLVPPSCARCVVLAGRIYKSEVAFLRHPRCDCRHIPTTENVAGDLTTDPLAAVAGDKVTDPRTGELVDRVRLSEADRKAILDGGADVSKVVNAHRGMSEAQSFGQKVKVTTEGTGRGSLRRGVKTIRATGPDGVTFRARLRPESIYKLAKNREDAIRLLKLYGFIV